MNRRHSLSGALAMAVAMIGAVAPSVPASGPAQTQAPSGAREYMAPIPKRLRGKKQVGARDPKKPQPLQRLKNGGMIDGRGDYRSPKRLHKEALKLVHGVTSGRQWGKLRRALHRMAKRTAP